MAFDCRRHRRGVSETARQCHVRRGEKKRAAEWGRYSAALDATLGQKGRHFRVKNRRAVDNYVANDRSRRHELIKT